MFHLRPCFLVFVAMTRRDPVVSSVAPAQVPAETLNLPRNKIALERERVRKAGNIKFKIPELVKI